MLRIGTARQLGTMWAIAVIVFIVSARVSIALAPAEMTPNQTFRAAAPSYFTGLVGLVGVGVALVLTWGWARRTESDDLGIMVQLAVILGAVLWLLAMIFPFL